MKKMTRMLSFALALMLLLSLVSCGGAKNEADYDVPADMGGTEEGYWGNGLNGKGTVEDSSEETSDSGVRQEQNEMAEKIIYTANVCAQTKDYDKAREDLTKLISTCGGYVQSCDEYTGGYYYEGEYYTDGERNATYTLRIPTAKFEFFLESVGQAFNVTERNTEQQNVTMQYVDLDARIKNMQAQEKRLQELLDQAKDLDQVLKIESELTNTRSEIESLTAQMRVLENRISYSTITLELRETRRYTPQAETAFGKRVLQELSRSWEKLREGSKDFVLFLSGNILQLLIFAAVAVVVIRFVKRRDGIKLCRRKLFRKKNKGEAEV